MENFNKMKHCMTNERDFVKNKIYPTMLLYPINRYTRFNQAMLIVAAQNIDG